MDKRLYTSHCGMLTRIGDMKEKLMNVMNHSEVQKVLKRAKEAQAKLKGILESQDWIEEARKYAEKQSKEVKKLLSNDAGKVRAFLEKERKELERFQKEIPGEVKKLRGFVKAQRKELEKLLKNLRRASKTGNLKALKKTKSSPKKRKAASAAKSASEGAGATS